MAALTAARKDVSHRGALVQTLGRPAAASQTIYNGALVALNASGLVVPAAGTEGLKCVGVADLDNKSSVATVSGDRVAVKTGIFPFKIGAGGDALVQADAGHPVYVLDDQTVGKTDGGVRRPVAGQLIEIDGTTAWVAIGFETPNLRDLQALINSAPETVTTGALSINKRTSLIDVTGTKAYTLADGTRIGQRKSIRVIVAASTPDGTLTPSNLADGTSIDLDAVNESVELEWDGTNWRIVHIVGATINA